MDENTLIKRFGIGLTGGIATGKTAVAQMLKRAGYKVIDADHLARLAVEPASPGLEEVVKAFGTGILQADGSLDRKNLGQLVFSDPQQKARLESILHPRIAQLLHTRLRQEGIDKETRPWFYEAALLYETGSYRRFHSVWLTWCPAALQQERLMQRAQISAEEAARLIASQMPSAKKKAMADVIIDTSASLADVEKEVAKLLLALRQTSF